MLKKVYLSQIENLHPSGTKVSSENAGFVLELNDGDRDEEEEDDEKDDDGDGL